MRQRRPRRWPLQRDESRGRHARSSFTPAGEVRSSQIGVISFLSSHALTTRFNHAVLSSRIGRDNHQVVENAAFIIQQHGITLAANAFFKLLDLAREQAFQARRFCMGGFMIKACYENAWPICETSKRPAFSRVCRCSFNTPDGKLHRHIISGELHHFAPSARCSVLSGVFFKALICHFIRPTTKRRDQRSGDPGCHGNLRDFARTQTASRSAYSFGGTAHLERRPLSSLRWPMRSFCLRVSGAVAPSAPGRPINDAILSRIWLADRSYPPAVETIGERQCIESMILKGAADFTYAGAGVAIAFDLKTRRVHLETRLADGVENARFDRHHFKLFDV